MSRKYIGQINNSSFVFPNNYLAEYDQEIIHNLDENNIEINKFKVNSVTGTTSSLTVNFDYAIDFNGAQKFLSDDIFGYANIFSIHMLAPNQQYYKPWRCVYFNENISSPEIFTGDTQSFIISSTIMGLGASGFTNGTYVFEFRAIGKKQVVTALATINVTTIPVPTPTPSPTPPVTSTPAPTPTPTVNVFTSGITINVTDTGYIKYNTPSGDTYTYLGSLGTQDLSGCIDCTTIRQGIPFADLANFTIVDCGVTC
jgi:hypothetical protein